MLRLTRAPLLGKGIRMDAARFDSLTRILTTLGSRCRALAALSGGIGLSLGASSPRAALVEKICRLQEAQARQMQEEQAKQRVGLYWRHVPERGVRRCGIPTDFLFATEGVRSGLLSGRAGLRAPMAPKSTPPVATVTPHVVRTRRPGISVALSRGRHFAAVMRPLKQETAMPSAVSRASALRTAPPAVRKARRNRRMFSGRRRCRGHLPRVRC
jgi:hypothetical protein